MADSNQNNSLIKKIITAFMVILVLVFTFYSWMNTRVPKYSGKEEIKGIIETVEVHRDDFGVPKIFAKNSKDLYFALGYVYASERLFQMQILKRVIAGRLSEVIGIDGLKIDKLFRTLGLKRNSAIWILQNQKKFNPEAFENLKDYIRGVNYFIQNGKTPVEQTLLGMNSETIDVEDVFGFVAYMGFSFAEAMHTDPVISALEKKLGTAKLNDITKEEYSSKKDFKNFASISNEWFDIKNKIFELGLPLMQGSNSWVISPKRAVNGSAMLANDPHIAFSNPSIWFEAYLHTNDFEIYGHFMPFIPFAAIGFNKKLAWGITMFENDDMDFYSEKINPKNSRQTLFQNKPEDIKFTNEIIHIKGESEPIEINVRETRHGVIISDLVEHLKNSNELVSMKWAMFFENNNPLNAFFSMNHAYDVKSFSSNLSDLKAPGLNLVVATAKGDTAYFAAGGLYKKDFATDRILDGESGKFEWGQEIPFSQNPSSINSASGVFFTANNRHFSNLPYSISGYWQADDRSNQITKNLNSKEKFSTEDMKSIILDDYFDAADFILPNLFSSLEHYKEKLSPTEKDSFEILKNWNRKGELDSIGASIFSEFRINVAREIFLDEMEANFYKEILITSRIDHYIRRIFANPNSDFWDNVNTKEREDMKFILFKSFQSTISSLLGKLDTNPKNWQWKKLHTLTLNHPLGKIPLIGKLFNSGPRSINGGSETINNQLTKYHKNSHEIEAGPSMRTIIDFARLDEILLINPLGQSGHVLSPFHHNQAKMYSKGEFRKMNFYEMRETNVNKILSLIPK